MADRQEEIAGRIGNTTKILDAPVGHFDPTLKGAGDLAHESVEKALWWSNTMAVFSPVPEPNPDASCPCGS